MTLALSLTLILTLTLTLTLTKVVDGIPTVACAKCNRSCWSFIPAPGHRNPEVKCPGCRTFNFLDTLGRNLSTPSPW